MTSPGLRQSRRRTSRGITVRLLTETWENAAIRWSLSLGRPKAGPRWRMMTAERIEQFTGFILPVLDLFLSMWFHQTVPPDRGRSHEAHANGEGCGACGFGLASRASGGPRRHRPAQLRGSVRQRAGGADESGGNPVESRVFEWAPLSVSRRRSRGLRKTPQWSAARRAGPRYGPAVPSRWRDRPDREAGHGVRRSTPAPFGAPLPHVR